MRVVVLERGSPRTAAGSGLNAVGKCGQAHADAVLGKFAVLLVSTSMAALG